MPASVTECASFRLSKSQPERLFSLRALRLSYIAGIQPNTTVWPAGTAPLPA